jgi:L-threonylcarbamoyladenylate synthase
MTASILSADAPDAIAEAARLIRAGAAVAFPTETIYGIAVMARDPRALALLAEIKGREAGRGIPTLVGDRRQLHELVAAIPPPGEALIARHWPGPLTLVLPAAPGLPPALLGEGGGIGVRISSDPIAGALVAAVGEPITATSANPSGLEEATTAARAALLPGISLVLDGGVRARPASTVVAILRAGEPRLLRAGATPLRPEDLGA